MEVPITCALQKYSINQCNLVFVGAILIILQYFVKAIVPYIEVIFKYLF